MVSLLFYAMTYKYLAGGPFAPHEVVDAENCKVNWWSNLLMMHNIVSTDKLVSGVEKTEPLIGVAIKKIN